MRAKADRLANARKDVPEMVGLMRKLADGMESGELYEPDV